MLHHGWPEFEEVDGDADSRGSSVSDRRHASVFARVVHGFVSDFFGCDLEMATRLVAGEQQDDFEAALQSYVGGIYKRRDYWDQEDAAQSHPNRTYYFRKQSDKQALSRACSRRIAVAPADVKARSMRASIFSKQGKYPQAVEDFSVALQCCPRDTSCLYGRGVAREKCGLLKEAIEDFTKILEDVDPEHYSAAYARADCYNRLGKYEAAIRDYNFALSRDNVKALRPVTPRLFVSAGGSTGIGPSDDDTDEGHEQTTSSRIYTSSDAGSIRRRERKRSSPTPSRTDAGPGCVPEVTISESLMTPPLISPIHDDNTPEGCSPTNIPSRADCHHQRGFALRKQGRFAEAVAEYTRSLQLNPRCFKALFNRGFAFDKLQRFPEAIRDYTEALKVDQYNAFVPQQLVWLLLHLVLPLVFTIVLNAWQCRYAYYNRGISHDRSGDFASAIKDFSKAIEVLPTKADFYHNRGFCHRKRADFSRAVVDYTAALAIDPAHFKAVFVVFFWTM